MHIRWEFKQARKPGYRYEVHTCSDGSAFFIEEYPGPGRPLYRLLWRMPDKTQLRHIRPFQFKSNLEARSAAKPWIDACEKAVSMDTTGQWSRYFDAFPDDMTLVAANPQFPATIEVVTWQSPSGDEIDLCQKCERRFKMSGKWPKDSTGEYYCTVSYGLHGGICDECGYTFDQPLRKAIAANPPSQSGPTELEINAFVDAYTGCLLWASDLLDKGYTGFHVDSESMQRIYEEANEFLVEWNAYALIMGEPAVRSRGCSRVEQAGSDFCLARNRLGAGFKHEIWPKNGSALAQIANRFSEAKLHVGEDGFPHYHSSGSRQFDETSHYRANPPSKYTKRYKSWKPSRLHGGICDECGYTFNQPLRKTIPQSLQPGDIVQIAEGSGTVSNMVGVVVDRREVKTDGRGIPTNVQGAYKPVDWSREVAVRLSHGELITMFKNRLIRVERLEENPQQYNAFDDRARIQRILQLASEKTEDEQIKQWLIWDEFGTWEKTVCDWLNKTAQTAERLNLTQEQVDNELASRIFLLAADATISHEGKRQRKRR